MPDTPHRHNDQELEGWYAELDGVYLAVRYVLTLREYKKLQKRRRELLDLIKERERNCNGK